MGKKGSCFFGVRKVLSHHHEKKDKKPNKCKNKWFQEEESVDVISFLEQSQLEVLAQPPMIETSELAHLEAAEPSLAEAQLAVDVEYPPRFIPRRPEMSEETAAIMIQAAFRGYTARRALRALKASMRLKALAQGQSVKRQVAHTLKYMQTITHLQAEIHKRRIRMSEENQSLHRQLYKKREKHVEKLKSSMDNDWNHSTQSKAQIEAKLLNKQVGALRRERALAYAYSHQPTWKFFSRTATPSFMDPNNPHWGWSWLERWMAARPWELRITDEQLDHISVMSIATRASVVDIIQICARRDQIFYTKPSLRSPTSQLHRHHSSSTSKPLSPSSSRNKKNAANSGISSWGAYDVNSKLFRRHTIGGSSLKDDTTIASSPSVSSHTTPSKAAKTPSRFASSSRTEKKGTMEKGSTSTGSARKQLSFTSPPVKPRRRSSPPLVKY
ncbi:protein IQ-DOMAIN 1-like [Cucurbita pepo subsp. pepo]|uniref:protein IQ-DOMAIN 1-like n=1 Tax=Cucurbita pepo subsp. pepo TaxID=3664 RepID=UPI000C9D90B3|nr:protein IQ-DOMAIN 1-like [Cucurbita pepo subsp. pepo]